MFFCESFWQDHFRSKICKELSSSKGVYTTQRDGSVSGETYCLETELENYVPESYIFIRQCLDNTVVHDAQKGTLDEQNLYPLTSEEWETWFTTFFFSPVE